MSNVLESEICRRDLSYVLTLDEFVELNGFCIIKNSRKLLKRHGLSRFDKSLVVLEFKKGFSDYEDKLKLLEGEMGEILFVGFEADDHDYYAGPIFVADLSKDPLDLAREHFDFCEDGKDEVAFMKSMALRIITNDRYL